MAGLNFVAAPSYGGVASAGGDWQDAGVVAYRAGMLRACLKALQLCHASGGTLSFYDAAVHVREQSRLLGRALPRRAVGSNLLLKGLEGEVAVILDADELDSRHLYVSMTRGSNPSHLLREPSPQPACELIRPCSFLLREQAMAQESAIARASRRSVRPSQSSELDPKQTNVGVVASLPPADSRHVFFEGQSVKLLLSNRT